jgi:hypothetical protein
MGIINRRNAVLGWGVWKVAKRVGRQKVKAAVPGIKVAVPGTGERARLNKSAIASVFAAIGGVLWFWRKKSDEGSPTSSP